MKIPIELSPQFLASDYVPRMSLLSGRTDGLTRGNLVVKVKQASRARFEIPDQPPVALKRVPLAHLELATLKLLKFFRLCLVLVFILAGIGLVVWSIMTQDSKKWSGYIGGSVVGIAAVSYQLFDVLDPLQLYYGLGGPTEICRLNMRDIVEVRYSPRLIHVAEAWQTAYQRWVDAGQPEDRVETDAADEAWIENGPAPGWDEAPPGA